MPRAYWPVSLAKLQSSTPMKASASKAAMWKAPENGGHLRISSGSSYTTHMVGGGGDQVEESLA